MATLLTLDPGKNYVAFAKFNDGLLVHAETVKSKKLWPESALEVAKSLKAYGPVDEFVFEFPVVYPKRTRSPNDLLPLCYVNGLVTAVLEPQKAEAVEPARWKGTIDPDIVIARVQGALTAGEHAVCKSKDHNTWDAIGIGLWKLKRIHIGR
jgi:hypothetical protein